MESQSGGNRKTKRCCRPWGATRGGLNLGAMPRVAVSKPCAAECSALPRSARLVAEAGGGRGNGTSLIRPLVLLACPVGGQDTYEQVLCSHAKMSNAGKASRSDVRLVDRAADPRGSGKRRLRRTARSRQAPSRAR